jgi:hypothetical protein
MWLGGCEWNSFGRLGRRPLQDSDEVQAAEGERENGSSCGGFCNGLRAGIAEKTAGPTGKPVPLASRQPAGLQDVRLQPQTHVGAVFPRGPAGLRPGFPASSDDAGFQESPCWRPRCGCPPFPSPSCRKNRFLEGIDFLAGGPCLSAQDGRIVRRDSAGKGSKSPFREKFRLGSSRPRRGRRRRGRCRKRAVGWCNVGSSAHCSLTGRGTCRANCASFRPRRKPSFPCGPGADETVSISRIPAEHPLFPVFGSGVDALRCSG